MHTMLPCAQGGGVMHASPLEHAGLLAPGPCLHHALGQELNFPAASRLPIWAKNVQEATDKRVPGGERTAHARGACAAAPTGGGLEEELKVLPSKLGEFVRSAGSQHAS